MTNPALEHFEKRIKKHTLQLDSRTKDTALIWDLWCALKEASTENAQQATDAEIMRAQAGVIKHLRAENERLRELLGGCCDWIEENHTWLDAPYCLTVGRAELKQMTEPPINEAYIQDTETRLRREIELLRADIERLRAENEQLYLQREGLLCRVAELRAEIELVSK